jgi:hypothetical protein
VILGTDPSAGPRTYFNAEGSGLPGNAAPAFAKLKKVRQALVDVYGDLLPKGTNYRAFTVPAPVVVDGSLFFDVDHPAGEVGPQKPVKMQPKTAWEIHPITSLRRQ